MGSVDRASCRILGCHVVGERAVEIAQLAAIAMTAQMPVDELARVAVSFPTYAEVLVHAAVRAAIELGLPLSGQAEHVGAYSDLRTTAERATPGHPVVSNARSQNHDTRTPSAFGGYPCPRY